MTAIGARQTTTAPRYYYSYNGHGDVVALTDAKFTLREFWPSDYVA